MFPPVESDNYLLRREQIGGKKRKNDHKTRRPTTFQNEAEGDGAGDGVRS